MNIKGQSKGKYTNPAYWHSYFCKQNLTAFLLLQAKFDGPSFFES